MAQGDDYDDAYDQLNERVDLFNLLLLPKSAGDTGSPSIRSSLWGAASAFCQRKRAFLIADIEPTTQTPDGVLQALQDFRTGVVKDHSGRLVAAGDDCLQRYPEEHRSQRLGGRCHVAY